MRAARRTAPQQSPRGPRWDATCPHAPALPGGDGSCDHAELAGAGLEGPDMKPSSPQHSRQQRTRNRLLVLDGNDGSDGRPWSPGDWCSDSGPTSRDCVWCRCACQCAMRAAARCADGNACRVVRAPRVRHVVNRDTCGRVRAPPALLARRVSRGVGRTAPRGLGRGSVPAAAPSARGRVSRSGSRRPPPMTEPFLRANFQAQV